MNAETLLLRQSHPTWVYDGRVTSQAFCPTRKKDEKGLSVSNGNKISAEDSWKKHTNTLKLQSVGVWAVSVEECTMFLLQLLKTRSRGKMNIVSLISLTTP